jgi:hypothetical protein
MNLGMASCNSLTTAYVLTVSYVELEVIGPTQSLPPAWTSNIWLDLSDHYRCDVSCAGHGTDSLKRISLEHPPHDASPWTLSTIIINAALGRSNGFLGSCFLPGA